MIISRFVADSTFGVSLPTVPPFRMVSIVALPTIEVGFQNGFKTAILDADNLSLTQQAKEQEMRGQGVKVDRREGERY